MFLVLLLLFLLIAGYLTNLKFGHQSFFCECDLITLFKKILFQLFNHLGASKSVKKKKRKANRCREDSTESRMNSFDYLGPELLSKILDYLQPFELVTQTVCINQEFRDIVQSESLWQDRFQRQNCIDYLEPYHRDLVRQYIFFGTKYIADTFHLHSRSSQKLVPSLPWKHNFFIKQYLQPEEILKSFSKWGRVVIAINSEIYDVTDFLEEHPGGDSILQEYSGSDASVAFKQFSHSKVAHQRMEHFLIYTNRRVLGCKGNLHQMPELLKCYKRKHFKRKHSVQNLPPEQEGQLHFRLF